MKRLIYIIVALLTLTSCEWGEAYTPNRSLGSWMWQGVREDIARVVEIMEFLELYGDYTLLEDNELKADFKETHLSRYDIKVEGNLHTLTYNTAYGTTITTLITVKDSNNWHISRTGGNHYDIDLELNESGIFKAKFNSMGHDESTGEGEFIAYRNVDNNIVLEGDMVMVDPEESSAKPLTFTTDIKQPLVINSSRNRLLDGNLTIECYDKLYKTTDKATIDIVKNRDDYEPYDATVYIHCYNEIETYDNIL